MLNLFKKLTYGVRIVLGKKQQQEPIDVGGRSTMMMHGGDESATPFLYLHSTLGESFRWFPFHEALSKHFHVYAPMHPGFSKSEGFDQIDSIEDMAFHYIEMFDALRFQEPIIIGGVSLGGWIAAEIACRWPERIKKLWIADAPGLWVEDVPLTDLFRHLPNPTKMREILFADTNFWMAREIIKDRPSDEEIMVGYQNMTVLARVIWERPYNPKLADRLKRVECPTLLLWGEKDRLVPTAYGEAYRKCIKNSELKLIPDCGHLPMFEKELEFVSALVEFCQK
ncbi:MAG: alpha/beta fold hydrolase [Gemmataceae bacterium]